MLTFTKCVYRKAVHWKIREFLWHLRGVVKAGRNKEARRSALADVRLLFNRPIASVPMGQTKLFVDLRDEGVGRALYIQHRYEPVETAFLQSVLKPGMNVFDVGANIGYFTIVASRCVGSEGRVFAVEPDPHNFSLLQKNVSANQRTNVLLHNEGLGSKAGSLKLFRSANNFGDHRLFALNDKETEERGQIQVSVDTMDALLERHSNPKMDCVKMDVQGYEHHVVQGMTETFRRNPSLILLMEFWPHGILRAGSEPKALFDHLVAKGYLAYLLTKEMKRIDWKELLEVIPPMDPLRADQAFVNVVFRR